MTIDRNPTNTKELPGSGVVDQFIKLGSLIIKAGGCDTEIKRTPCIAQNSMSSRKEREREKSCGYG